jgi:hypothetical protein
MQTWDHLGFHRVEGDLGGDQKKEVTTKWVSLPSYWRSNRCAVDISMNGVAVSHAHVFSIQCIQNTANFSNLFKWHAPARYEFISVHAPP